MAKKLRGPPLTTVRDNAARTGGTPRDELQVYRCAEPEVPSGGSVVEVDT
jgi:hypothetical protein